MTLSNMEAALYTLGVFAFILLVMGAFRWRERGRRKKRPMSVYLGWLLIGFALYVIPFGVMDLYEITELSLRLTYLENYFLWIGISVVAIVAGIFLLRRSKK